MPNSDQPTRRDCIKVMVISIWAIIMTWATFFSRLYDGPEYFIAMIITWVAGTAFIAAIPKRKKDE